MNKLKNWFNGLSKTGKVVAVATASVLAIGTIGAAAQPAAQPTSNAKPSTAAPIPKTEPKIETKTETTTETIPFTSSTIDDTTLPIGTSQTKTAGVNGVRTHVFEVVYTDGVETSRKEVRATTTAGVVNEVIAKGSKPLQAANPEAQTSCPNGSYTNTYGNIVCRPYESSSAPNGASAKCSDGTYSFSQSRRGTCSGHGGVAIWL